MIESLYCIVLNTPLDKYYTTLPIIIILNTLIHTECDGQKLSVTSPKEDSEVLEIGISLTDIMIFGTGASTEPPLGFHPNPRLEFKTVSDYPSANTCTSTIYLPAREMTSEIFNYFVAFGIANSFGFGHL